MPEHKPGMLTGIALAGATGPYHWTGGYQMLEDMTVGQRGIIRGYLTHPPYSGGNMGAINSNLRCYDDMMKFPKEMACILFNCHAYNFSTGPLIAFINRAAQQEEHALENLGILAKVANQDWFSIPRDAFLQLAQCAPTRALKGI